MNVLLALLSGSVMSGVAAFLFSTAVITVSAEILLWGERRRIVTGTDILGRLLRGIARRPVDALA